MLKTHILRLFSFHCHCYQVSLLRSYLLKKIKLLFEGWSQEALLFSETFFTKSTRVHCAGHTTSPMKLN